MVIKEFRGDYWFLSNFYECWTIRVEGLVVPSLEHAFQAAKTTDHDWRIKIACASLSKTAKQLGRKAPIREDWEEIKSQTMYELLQKKFKREDLREKLLATGNDHLVEGNWWGDTYWGVDLRTGEGQNQLGHSLMMVRAELRK